ncbi:MAG: hypothetical protein K9H49_10965 [Bacteroidales bacterium]|nr:hypothetical protein [Bacteroidales bacterium]
MITGIKAYSIDRYCEKLLINPTDLHPAFKPLYTEELQKPEPERNPGESKEEFKDRVRKESSIEVENFTLFQDVKFRSKQYRISYELHYQLNGKAINFGHLSWNNKIRERDINLICFDISNYLFYQDEIDIEAIRSDLLKTFKLEHNNYHHFEICLDTNYDIIRNFERRYKNRKKYYFKSCNRIDKSTLKILGYERDRLIGEQFIFKSHSYKEVFRFYNKSLELASNNKKSYLYDYFVRNGLDITKPIYRIEISMSWKSDKRPFVNLDINNFTNNYRLKRILNEYIRMYLDFRIIDHNKNKSRYKRDSFV